MALEEQIAALIVALNANTAAVAELNAGRAEVVARIDARAAVSDPAAEEKPAAAKTTTKPKAEDKPAPTETVKAEEPKVEEKAPEPNPYEGLREIVADYLATDRAEERQARQQKVLALLNHEKIRKADLAADAKPDVLNIAVTAIDLFKKQIAMLKEKGDITAPASDEALLA